MYGPLGTFLQGGPSKVPLWNCPLSCTWALTLSFGLTFEYGPWTWSFNWLVSSNCLVPSDRLWLCTVWLQTSTWLHVIHHCHAILIDLCHWLTSIVRLPSAFHFLLESMRLPQLLLWPLNQLHYNKRSCKETCKFITLTRHRLVAWCICNNERKNWRIKGIDQRDLIVWSNARNCKQCTSL